MPDETPQQKLDRLVARGQELAKNPLRSADEMKEMEAILTESRDVRAQLAQDASFQELNQWAGQSAGKLGMATPGAPTQFENFTPAPPVVVNQHESGRRTLTDDYEETPQHQMATVTGDREYKKNFHGYLRSVGNMHQHVRYADSLTAATRTLQESVDPSGGFLVPPDFLEKIISKEPTPTRVAARVTQLQTGRDSLIIPRVNYPTDDLYTSGIRVVWSGENPASAASLRATDPIFGRSQIPVFTAMFSLPLTNDLIEDTAFPLLDWVAGKFRETIELLRDNMILNGTGLGQPSGILLNPGDTAGTQPAVVVSGSASTITADSIIKTAMTLPEQYDDNSSWVFNKTSTALVISQLKDSQNRYMWGAGYQDSGIAGGFLKQPLVGYPVVLSGFMPNIGASTYPAIFGDLSGYYLVNRIGFSIQVLRELYAETNQVLVLGRIRFGGQVVEQWRLKVLQCHT